MAYSVFKRFAFVVVATCAVGCQLGPQTASKSNSFNPVQLVKKTSSRVGNAFRITPRVVKASDPTALDFDSGPIKPSLHLAAATVMQRSGKLEGAHQHYAKALESEPSNRKALIGVARLYQQQGKLTDAIDAYREATRILGSDAVVLNDLALCLSREKRYDESIESLREALSLKPDSLLYQNNLAAVLIQADRADEAVSVLVERHGPAVAHYNVGYLLNQSGEPAAASAHFVRSLQANPSFLPAQLMLDRVLPEVGQRSIERVAKLPNDSLSSTSPQVISPQVISPVSDRVALPDETNAKDGGAAGAAAEALTNAAPTVAAVQPAEFTQPVDDGDSLEPQVDVAEPPPIRLPAPGARRRPNAGPGGFVAPAPAA